MQNPFVCLADFIRSGTDEPGAHNIEAGSPQKQLDASRFHAMRGERSDL